MAAEEEKPAPVLGIPYGGGGDFRWGSTAMYRPIPQGGAEGEFHVGWNPYQAGMIPPNAIFGDPKGIPIHQTIFRDTPAPFNCVFCGNAGLTHVRSKRSLAAFVGCMTTMMVGFCFLLPSMDCLWHKYHYCPNCGEKCTQWENMIRYLQCMTKEKQTRHEGQEPAWVAKDDCLQSRTKDTMILKTPCQPCTLIMFAMKARVRKYLLCIEILERAAGKSSLACR